MPYPPMLVEPMRAEARQLGCEELLTAEAVEQALSQQQGTTLVFVNSVCGCAAGGARPGLALALQHAHKPDRAITVFAGQDLEATARARESFAPYQPSSPQIGLLKDGKLVYMMQRHDIEGRSPDSIAQDLKQAFDQNCSAS